MFAASGISWRSGAINAYVGPGIAAIIILIVFIYAQTRLAAVGRENSSLAASNRELRARAEEDIRSERVRFESMLEELPAGVIIINPNGKITFANSSANRLLVTKKRDLKNAPLSRFSVDFALSKQIGEALSGTEIVKEIKVRKPEERIIRAWIRPVMSGGKVVEAVAVLEDVTRLRRLEDMRRELVSSFSHELRTPIASNQATLEALLDMGADEDPVARRKFLKNLRTQTEHLSNLVTEMLQLTKLESGAAIAKLEAIDAADMAAEAVDAIRVLAEAKDIRLALNAPAGVSVMADRRLFIQALINLLDNAIKYTESGGLVSLAVTNSGKRAVFTVSDTGRGIPKDALPHIFDRFYRVDKHRSRDAGGTGLGLAITKHIAEAHNGRVKVESVLHEGSTFTITIKLA
jgi:two-component system, OmpR family, phosphate regulon sensor histidine kinase PhoR